MTQERFDRGLDMKPTMSVVSMKDYEDVAVRTQRNKSLQTAIRMELVKVGMALESEM